ncbi:hypothetical protein ROJ8625_04028 [Roseivivax jejudonensis]|uniref:Holin-X, holin superfamily III n=1 Tax=Roseivivax jejudonensis TaxID=1529041 RepID=A0A1X7AAF4_9RHOB|nr:phage holin family protein [Roseivivax jejudonensis]SLN74251.1 hypothetical protein ROJ8625_04028 [Roseivivax jejudonensis]
MALFAYYEALARRKVRGAAYSLTGVLFLLVGVGFLAAALWMVLAELRDAQFAALVMGFGFVAIGLIVMGIGKLISRLRVRHVPPLQGAATRAPLIQLVEGFLVGVDAGRRSRGPRRD